MLLFCLKISKKIIPTAGSGLRFFYFDKNLKSQCVIPGQEHLPELAIMPDPLNTFDVMGWLKKEAMLSKYKLLHYRI